MSDAETLRTGQGSRDALNRLVSRNLAYWVPTTWLTQGGYFLTERGERLQARIMRRSNPPA